MRLSVVIPTHRSDLLACSRIVQACSWAGPNVEVIVRDNSGNAFKRDLLARIKHEQCNIIAAEPCSAVENYTEALRLAKGEFVYVVADDDFGFDRAMSALPGLIGEHIDNPSIVGIAGNYAIEQENGSSFVAYQNLESDDVTVRLAGYLAHHGANVLVYSPIRMDLYQRTFDFKATMPFDFSFRDQIQCLLYLLNGKFVRLKRLMYLYDAGEWDTADKAQNVDLIFYTRSNQDPAINRLHWFICGFEGAVLIRNADVFPDYALPVRQAMADRWFSTMFMRFKNSTRSTFGSAHTGAADALYEKWKVSAGQLSFHDMLKDTCDFMALSSQDHAQKYSGYWSAMLSNGSTVGRQLRAAQGR
jgi:hypothetical protein